MTKSFGTRRLFAPVSLGVFEGEKVGLIGPNGSGKSTLLRILAGEDAPDGGEVSTRRQLRLSYVAQADEFPFGATVESILLAALRASALDEHERFVAVDVMLGKMGFLDRAQPAEALSGGWRKRLALARALITNPELVLLDEPTNHLDLEGILWLEALLKSAPFAFVLVSHDRYLLEHVTTRTMEINRAYPDGYFATAGPYSDFLLKREEFLEGQQARQQALAAQVRQEVEWLRRGARARTTKAKGRIEDAGKLIEEYEESKTRSVERNVRIDFTATGRRTKRLLTAKGLGKTLGGRTLFRDLDLELLAGMKLGIVGANGSGKTTLLRILSGELAPDAGTLWRADGLRTVIFSQHRETLDPAQSLRRALAPLGDTVIFRDQPVHVTAWAKRFLFDPEQLPLPVEELSGGEQARILIARLMLQPADVLILDEPTNDLDIPSLEVLEASLDDFPGVLVLVTHDRFMLDRLCTELLALDGQGHAAIFAEFAQWERARDAAAAPPPPPRPAAKPDAKPAIARPRAFTWKEARELEVMEDTTLAAEADVERLMTEMAATTDHRTLHDLSTALHAAQEHVKTVYARWEALEAKKAAAEG